MHAQKLDKDGGRRRTVEEMRYQSAFASGKIGKADQPPRRS
jgi:hypothetical protein